jgi:uncharacterized protein DUF4154
MLFCSNHTLLNFKYNSWFSYAILAFIFNTIICFELSANRFSETDIKAAYVYNFIHFIEWPEQIPQTLSICLYSTDDKYKTSFKSMPSITKAGKPIKKIYLNIKDNPLEIDECHILYITNSNIKKLNKILTQAINKNILTIGEMGGFLGKGGMINFDISNDKIVFEVNKSALKKANLNVSSQVLRMANRIFQEELK